MIQILIDVRNIKVDEFYYSFNYDVIINNKKTINNDYYESDHCWGSSKKEMSDFKKLLKKSEAYNLVLEKIDIR